MNSPAPNTSSTPDTQYGPMESPIVDLKNINSDSRESLPSHPAIIYYFLNRLTKLFSIYDFSLTIAARISDKIEDLSIWNRLKEAVVFLSKHPTLSYPLFLVLMTAGIPIFCFLTFCLLTTVLTFSGLVFIEGSIMIFISIVIAGCTMVVFSIVAMCTMLFSLYRFTFYRAIEICPF